MYEQPKSKKRIVRNCNDRRKGTDQPDVCTDDTVCSKKPENVCQGAKRGACKDAPHGASYESVFKSGRKGSGKLSKPSERDTSAGRASVKGRNISGPDGTCSGCDGEKTDVPRGTDRAGRESKGNSRTDRGAAEKHAGAWSISHRLAGSA